MVTWPPLQRRAPVLSRSTVRCSSGNFDSLHLLWYQLQSGFQSGLRSMQPARRVYSPAATGMLWVKSTRHHPMAECISFPLPLRQAPEGMKGFHQLSWKVFSWDVDVEPGGRMRCLKIKTKLWIFTVQLVKWSSECSKRQNSVLTLHWHGRTKAEFSLPSITLFSLGWKTQTCAFWHRRGFRELRSFSEPLSSSVGYLSFIILIS